MGGKGSTHDRHEKFERNVGQKTSNEETTRQTYAQMRRLHKKHPLLGNEGVDYAKQPQDRVQ
jgi:hypothetical protein